MKGQFEDILKQKTSSIKISPSDKLTDSIKGEIKRYSLKTKLIRTAKISIAIISGAALLFYFATKQPANKTQQIAANKPVKTIQVEQKPVNTDQATKQTAIQQETSHNNNKTLQTKHITHTNKTETDTLIAKDEYSFPGNGLKWFSNQDNIIVSNTKGKVNIIFAKPGIYKIYAKDNSSNIKDSAIILSLFAMPDKITTCKNEYILPEGIFTTGNKKIIKKTKTTTLSVPVFVTAYSHKVIDTVTITFKDKPNVYYYIEPTLDNKFNITFVIPEDVKIFYNNKQITELQNVPAGTYTITAQNTDGCDTTITIKTDKAKLIDPEFEVQYLDNRSGMPIYFKNKTFSYGYKKINYHWNFGDGSTSTEENTSHIYEKEGKYTITLVATAEDGTSKTKSRTIILLPPKATGQPNVFTPNGDGQNDVFKIQLPIKLSNFRCEIFSRSGKKIYEFTDPNGGWDGKIKGEPASQGIYYYIVTGNKDDGEPYVEKSFIYLYR